MDNSKVQEILEKQMLTVAKAVDDKIDDEIAVLDRLDIDDMEALRERRLQRMKKMTDKRRRWISLGHGDYSEIPVEKDFFSIVKASDRVLSATSIVKTGNANALLLGVLVQWHFVISILAICFLFGN